MPQEAGSYDFGTYEREKELKRLEAQATATWAVEAPLLAAAGLGKGERALDLGCGHVPPRQRLRARHPRRRGRLRLLPPPVPAPGGLFPEPPGYAAFTRRAAELQQARGGDRDVGRKIGWYYKRAGFAEVQVRVLVFTTDQVPMKSFLDIAVSFKKELFPSAERETAAEQLESFYRYIDRPDGFGLAGLYVVSGRKPA
jgi:hypothetical protein